MSLFHTNTLIGASGSGSGPLYVDDVFSTFLYDGNASGQGANAQSITNNIDLSGEGGLVWIKRRDTGGAAWSHYLFDTERGATKYLKSNDNDTEATGNNSLSAFNSDGFTLGETGGMNANNADFCSWTFRKAPGFFDIVTYTGNGTGGRTISHNLGSVPGFVIIKSTSHSTGWYCYHRSIGNDRYVQLSSTEAQSNSGFAIWNSTDPTSTEFTLGPTGWNVNKSGYNYVAYFFAHNDQSFGTDEDEAIIKCGSYDANNSSSGNTIDVGFEPQLVIIKSAAVGGDGYGWTMHDNMRDASLFAESHNQETNAPQIEFRSNGFHCIGKDSNINDGTGKYIYIAIRRPHKPPTAGTDVFKAVTYSGSSSAQTITGAGFPPDWMWSKDTSAANNGWHHDRMRGENSLDTSGTGAEQDRSSYVDPLGQDGVKFVSGGFDLNRNGSNHVAQFFKRAPGFFDIVCFTGNNSSTQNITHNLNAVPEFFMIKKRDSTGEFQCYHSGLGNTKYVKWDNVAAAVTSSARWNDTTPTSSVFTLGSEFQDTNDYVVYLFATLSGISKVGSYSGTGNNIDVDCGFSGGARYILIKRTDTDAAGTIGNWYVYDHARGINAGNDPYLWLNTTAAQVSNTDYIDPLNAGFTVTSSAPDGLNQSGGTYIFFAIA